MTGLALRDVRVAFGNTIALRDITLELPSRGLVIAFGPNGAGKSTLLDVLSGAVRPDSGTVSSPDDSPLPPWRLRGLTSRLHQRTLVPHDLSGGEILAFAAQHRRARDLLERISPFAAEPSLVRLCELASIHPATWQPLATMSGGQQRLVLLLGAFLTDRPHVLLDEPLAGMASDLADALVDFVRDQARKHLVVVVDHESEWLMPLSDRLIGLRAGELVLDGTFAEQERKAIGAVYGI